MLLVSNIRCLEPKSAFFEKSLVDKSDFLIDQYSQFVGPQSVIPDGPRDEGLEPGCFFP